MQASLPLEMLRSWNFLNHGEERINPILRHPEQGPVNSSLRVDKQSQMCDSTDKNCSRFTGYCSLKRKAAFTLAEVLITLGIIGVVAAMTLPTLIANYQKSVALNKLKQTYAQITVAMDKASAEYDGGPMENWCSGDETIDGITYTRYNQGCFHRAMKEIAVKMYPQPNSVNHAFCYDGKEYRQYTTMNGVSTSFTNTNQQVTTGSWSAKLPNGACVVWNALYKNQASGRLLIDIDGPYAGYNRVGKDVFIFSYIRSEDNIRPRGVGNNGHSLVFLDSSNKTRNQLKQSCASDYWGNTCSALIIWDGWQIKSDYPWQ